MKAVTRSNKIHKHWELRYPYKGLNSALHVNVSVVAMVIVSSPLKNGHVQTLEIDILITLLFTTTELFCFYFAVNIYSQVDGTISESSAFTAAYNAETNKMLQASVPLQAGRNQWMWLYIKKDLGLCVHVCMPLTSLSLFKSGSCFISLSIIGVY